MHLEPLDYLPLWALFPATVVLIYAAIELGYALGKIRRRALEIEKEATVGPIVGATLGLLAFMLAFTFGLAATRFDARRQIVVEEANAVGTAYLRAGLLPEPHTKKIRGLLETYVRVRLESVQAGNIDRVLTESTTLHSRLWDQAEEVAKQDSHSINTGLFIQSLNEVIDLHSKRVHVGLRSRVPVILWLTLYLVAVFSVMQLGYQAGLSASRRSPAGVTFVLIFSLVILLIADLDRPHEGLVRVSQQAMQDLQNSWTSP